MQFEWDEDKERLNIAKHGVSFGQATQAFADPLHLIIPDLGHSRGEARFLCLGEVAHHVRLFGLPFGARR